MKLLQLVLSAVAATAVLAESDWKAERRQYCPKCRPGPSFAAVRPMETVVVKREPEPVPEPVAEPVQDANLVGMRSEDIVDWKTERRQYCPKCPSVPPPSSVVNPDDATVKREAVNPAEKVEARNVAGESEWKAERRQYCPKCAIPQPGGSATSS